MHGDGRMEYFYKNDKNLLGKCEPAFGGGIRNYRSRGSGLWKGWVTFEAVEGEQYLFGDDIIFVPVVRQGQRVRRVYLPEGNWILTKDRSVHRELTRDIYD